MIACLRAARLCYPDDGASIFIELRRHHNIKRVGEAETALFSVTKRYSFMNGVVSVKNFSTINEARRYWVEQVAVLEDQGLRRNDPVIMGFHEED